MIKKYSLLALEKAVNLALSLDHTMADRLPGLQGKVLKIVITPLDVEFFIRFEAQQLKLQDACDHDPDTVIHSNPLGLIRLGFLPASRARSVFNDNIRLSGDLEFGQAVKQLFDELDIDWEGHLSHFTGDVIACQLGSWFRQGVAFHRHLGASLTHNLSEYLQEECRFCPPKEEVEDFFRDVETLSHDVERVEAELTLLMARS